MLHILSQVSQTNNSQLATVIEKMAQLEPAMTTINNVQVELRGLSEKVSGLEQTQSIVTHGIVNLSNSLSTTGNEIAKVQQELAVSQAKSDEKHVLVQKTALSITRLESVIAGTHSKGAAGENIIEVVFAKLPVEWQVRDLLVGGKVVEFGLRLPNKLILPIDSKWAATDLLEQFLSATEPDEQKALKGKIEKVVIQKAKEVKKYIDPSITVPFGVAVVPDAIYDLCSSIQAEVFELNVVLVSYSMFVPYLLLVFQTMLNSNQSIDLYKLDAHLQTVQKTIKAIQDEIDGRYSKAVTMLNNSRDDIRAHVSRANSSINSLQLTVPKESPSGLEENSNNSNTTS